VTWPSSLLHQQEIVMVARASVSFAFFPLGRAEGIQDSQRFG